MTALSDFITCMVKTMIKTLPDMVEAVKKAAAVLPSGEEMEIFKKKTELLTMIFGVISEVSKVLMEMNKMALEMEGGANAKLLATIFKAAAPTGGSSPPSG